MLHRKKFAEIVLLLQKQEKMPLNILAMLSRIAYMRLKCIIQGEVSPSLEEASSILHVFGKDLVID